MTIESTSDLKNTNEALVRFADFFFVENSLLTWLHVSILAAAFVLGLWLWRVHAKAERGGFAAACRIPQTPCALMAREWLEGVRQSNAQFLVAFGIGAIAFAIGVWFESVGSGGMVVQVATYCPAVILAFTQLSAIYRSGARVRRHLGV